MTTGAIKVTHCSEDKFLDAFRADLAGCTDRVLILSPFLSQNRALHYYPALRSLTTRGVTIDVYSRPRREQPESLREHYDGVERNLRALGARMHLRPGMHEKISVVDGRVLWHGSLNILSHNNTRESMLRFESPELVQEVLMEIGLGSYVLADTSVDAEVLGQEASPESPKRPTSTCRVCGDIMLLFEDAGMWICSRGPECPGAMPVAADVSSPPQVAAIAKHLALRCPICGSGMEISSGLEQRIVCTSASCAFSFDRRISAGLLRVLRRRAAV